MYTVPWFLYIRMIRMACFDTLFRSYSRTTECGFASHAEQRWFPRTRNGQLWQSPRSRQHSTSLPTKLVCNINSFNTHNFKIQDSGNHTNNCGSLRLPSCRSSIVSDEAARPFTSIRSILTFKFATSPWPTSLAKFHSYAGSTGPLVLHFSIFIDHGFPLSYLLRRSFAYWALREAYISSIAINIYQFVLTTTS